MNGDAGHRPDTSGAPGALERYLAEREAELEQRIAARVLAEVRRLLDRGAGVGPEWLSQPAAAKLAGVRAQTIREWQKAGVLTKGRRGRVNAAELRAYLAAEGGGLSASTPAIDLKDERARRAAREILAGGKRGGRGR